MKKHLMSLAVLFYVCTILVITSCANNVPPPPIEKVATPEISNDTSSITITCKTEGATIYWSTWEYGFEDSQKPATAKLRGHGSSPLTLTWDDVEIGNDGHSLTIHAKAVKAGMADSDVADANMDSPPP